MAKNEFFGFSGGGAFTPVAPLDVPLVTIKIVHSFHRLVDGRVEKYSTLEKLARLVTHDKPGVSQRIFTSRKFCEWSVHPLK